MQKSPSRRWTLWCVLLVLGVSGVMISRHARNRNPSKDGLTSRTSLSSNERDPGPLPLGESASSSTVATGRALFALAHPANAAALSAALPAPAHEIHYVRLNRALV